MGLSGRKFHEKGGNDSSNYVLFSYSTKHLSKTDKIRFYYALKGRDGKSGFVARTNSKHIGKTVLLVPAEFDKETQDFLNYWKCKFERKRIILLDDSQD